ncbi:MAG: hypothetical protein NT076_01290 [Candidatus Pacearchaeota archaeon]|nr:hypothetical protein [Candidatus Pacearchaeota archaeon]
MSNRHIRKRIIREIQGLLSLFIQFHSVEPSEAGHKLTLRGLNFKRLI